MQLRALIEESRRRAEDAIRDTAEAVRSLAARVTAETQAMPDRLLAQVALLPKPRDGRDGHLTIAPAWTHGRRFEPGELCRHRAGLWQAIDRTLEEPGPSADAWRIVADGLAAIDCIHDQADPRALGFGFDRSDGARHELTLRLPLPLHRGRYASDAVYELNDEVALNGSTWRCLVERASTSPPSEEWALVAVRGERGPRGHQGPLGDAGQQGVPGQDGAPGARGERGLRGRGIAGVALQKPGVIALQYDDDTTSPPVDVAAFRYHGVYQPGETYQPGDVVRLGFHLFIATRQTATVPSATADDWTLFLPGVEPAGGGAPAPAQPIHYQGTWEVAANNPDISAGTWEAGDFFIAVTADPSLPEPADPTIPGIGGQMIINGDWIIWTPPVAGWAHLGGAGLTRPEADARYVFKTGDTMTGNLIVGATGWPSYVGISGDLNSAVIELHGNDISGLNFFAGGAATQRRWSFGTTTIQNQDMDLEVVRWDATGLTPEFVPFRIRRTGGVQIEEELFFHKPGDQSGVTPAIRWADDGGNLAWIYATRGVDGSGNLIFRTENPGFGAATVMRTRPANPARLELLGEPEQPQDAVTKAYVDANSIEDAPADNVLYGRYNFAWIPVQPALDLRYVLKAGDTMTGNLIVGATGWPSYVGISGDLNSAVIELHGNDISALNFTVGTPAQRRWSFGATTIQNQDMDLEVVRWDATGLTPEFVPFRIRRTGGVQIEEELFFHKPGDQTGTAPAIRWADDGGNLAWVYAARSGVVGGPSLVFRAEDPSGAHTLMRSRPGDPAVTDDPSRLELMADPVQPQDAATKGYVDTVVGNIDAFVLKTGDTMTGNLAVGLGPPGPGTSTVTLGGGPLALIQLDGIDGEALQFARQGAGRWTFGVTPLIGQAEDMVIIRHNDDGSVADIPLRLALGSGLITTANHVRTQAGDPVDDNDLARKLYVDTFVTSMVNYQGLWQVAANSPDLITFAAQPGDYFIAETADPLVAEVAPPGIPGIGGETISNHDWIIWSPPLNEWQHLAGSGGGLTRPEADARYLIKAGDNMQGFLTLFDDPVADLHAASRRYVDRRITRDWAPNLEIAAGEVVRWDNMLFRARVAIPSAPATPDYSTLDLYGQNQGDYWHGAPSLTNYATGNWMQLLTVPVYGTFRFHIDAFGNTCDCSFLIEISTTFNAASMTVSMARNPAGILFDQFRLSDTGSAAAKRLEARIRTAGATPMFKLHCFGMHREVNTPNDVIIPKPPQALAGGVTLGGTQRVLLTGLDIAGATAAASNIIMTNSGFIRYGHVNATDVNDGKVGARLFSRGLNVIGAVTEAADTERYISLYGIVENQNRNYRTLADGTGYETFQGGRFYKAASTGLVIRCHTGNTQPQIENNDGSNRRVILDANNGVRKGGDTMTGNLVMHSQASADGNRYIFQKFNTALTEEVMFEARTGTTRGAYIRYDGGVNRADEGKFSFYTENGGWSASMSFRTTVASPPGIWITGDSSAQSHTNRSEAYLKQEIRYDVVTAARAFDALRPAMFKLKEPPWPPVDGDGRLKPTSYSKPENRDRFGFIVDDMVEDPLLSLTVNQDYMTKERGWDIAQVVALCVAKVRVLEAEIAELKARDA